MNHYNFDIRGHLQPSGVIQMTLSEFEDVFVASFEDSQTRLALFEEYKRYINDLQALLKSPFTQWIDGSFVNNRTRNPNDLDFVTVIDHEIYLANEKAIDERFGKYAVKQFYQKLDAYTLRFYPKMHELHTVYIGDCFYWQRLFSKTKANRANQCFEKGFIQLNFD